MKKSEQVREFIVNNNITEVTDEHIKSVQELTGFARALAKVYLKENIVRVAKMAAKAAAKAEAAAVEKAEAAAEQVVQAHPVEFIEQQMVEA